MKKLILSILVLSLGHTSFALVRLGHEQPPEALVVPSDDGVPLFGCGVSAGGEQLMCTSGELSKAIAMLRDNFNTGSVSAASFKVKLRKVADAVFLASSGVWAISRLSATWAKGRLPWFDGLLRMFSRATGAKLASDADYQDVLNRRLVPIFIAAGLGHWLTSPPHAGTPADQFANSHAADLFGQLNRKFRLESDAEILADAKGNQSLAALIIATASLTGRDN